MRHLVTAAWLAAAAGPAALAADRSDGFCTGGYSAEAERLAGEDRAAREFDAMDTDGDGAVGRDEYVACKNAAAGTTSGEAERTSANMGVVDADSSGDVSRDEFLTAANIARVDAGNAEGPDARQVTILRRFVFIPEDAVGAEIRFMSEYAGAQRARQMFHALDRNGDGMLDEGEWTQPQAELGDRSDMLATDFEKLDADGDGSLSAAEYSETVTPAPAVEEDT